MAQNLLTDSIITQEALMILENSLTFTKQVDRQLDTEYANAKRGAVISVRKAPRYVLRDGQNVAIQDTVQSQVPFVLSHQFGVDVEFYSSDLALSISDFGREILAPQIAVIANGIDFTGMQLANKIPMAVGTPGTTPGTGMTAQQTLAQYTLAGAMLDKTATPRDGQRAAVINEDAQAILISNLSGLFQDSSDIARQYREGTMGRTVGLKFSMDQNANVQTLGNFSAGTPLVNGGGQGQLLPPGTGGLGAAGFTIPTFLMKGFTPNTLVLLGGERFTFTSGTPVLMVNPASLQQAKLPQMFAVYGPVTSDGSGNAVVPMWPPIITQGAFQTVTASPTNNAAITFQGAANSTAVQNLVFHKTAFTFASCHLPLPGGLHMAARKSDKQLGMSLRFLADFNIATDQFIGRFDILCGWLAQRPEQAVVVYG